MSIDRRADVALEQHLRAHILRHNFEAERTHWEWHGLFKSQSQPPVTHLLQQTHTFQSFLNSFTNWRPSIQIHEPIQSFTVGYWYEGKAQGDQWQQIHSRGILVTEETWRGRATFMDAESNWDGFDVTGSHWAGKDEEFRDLSFCLIHLDA